MALSREAMAHKLAPGSAALCRTAPLAYAQRMGHIPEDSALMLRYKDGDTAAFETLYKRHNDALYRYLLRLCRHRATAEDIFQDVWGKIIKARSSYRPTAKFTTFMYCVARFTCRYIRVTGHDYGTQPGPGAPDTRAARFA